MTGEPRGDAWAPTPIAQIEAEIRAAEVGVVEAMSWRSDRVVQEIVKFSEEERVAREAAAKMAASPATNAYIARLENEANKKGKKFPTYRSDRPTRLGSAAASETYTYFSTADVRSRSATAASSSTSSSVARGSR